jgi:hypothetical protein
MPIPYLNTVTFDTAEFGVHSATVVSRIENTVRYSLWKNNPGHVKQKHMYDECCADRNGPAPGISMSEAARRLRKYPMTRETLIAPYRILNDC